jgi:hypothetical protein
MMVDLERYVDDDVGFEDRLPYVLDLLAGITRSIDEETRGHRSTQFASWWTTTDRSMQQAITELRHAELKRVESRTKKRTRIEISGPLKTVVMTIEGLTANQLSIVARTEWEFVGGDLDGKPVLGELKAYLVVAEAMAAKAEALLDQP